MSHRIGLRMCAAVSAWPLIVGLAACSGEAQNASPQTTATTSSTATSTSQAAPQRATKAPVPAGGTVLRNASTVYSNCLGDFLDGTDGFGEVFDPATGKNERITVPEVPAGEEFVHAACTVTTVGGKNRAIFVVVSKTPSQGLTPESMRARIIAVDPGSTTPVATKDWPAEIEPPFYTSVNGASVRSIQPVTDGFVAVGGMYGKTIVGLFDGDTLELTKQIPKSVAPDGSSTRVETSFGGVAVIYRDGNVDGPDDTFDAHFLSAADGAEIGTFTNVGDVIALDDGFLLSHSNSDDEDGSEPEPGMFYFDLKTRELIGPIAPWLDDGAYGDGVTALGGPQFGDVVLLRGYGVVGGNSFLDVYDLAARKTLFHLGNKEMEDLGVGAAYLGGNYLYLGKEPDNPVIDYRTSDTMASGWVLRPLASLADGWVVIQPDTAEGDSDNGEPRLARSADGDYAGPWF